MKRRLLIVFLLSLFAVGAVAVWRWWPRIASSGEGGDLYCRYCAVEGVEASFVKGFRVNDTVTVDVTVLRAETDSAWGLLQRDFGMTPPPPQVIEICGRDFIEVRMAPKNDYSGPKDPVALNNDVVSTSWTERTIWVFSIETEKQYSAVRRNQLDESIKHSLNQQ